MLTRVLVLAELLLVGCGLFDKRVTVHQSPIKLTPTSVSPKVEQAHVDDAKTVTDADLLPIAQLTIKSPKGTRTCMAAFVSDLLLTAAHCVADLSESNCRAGDVKIEWARLESGKLTKVGSETKCSSVVVDGTADPKNDLALLQLASGGVRPAQGLVLADAAPKTGKIFGFGARPGVTGELAPAAGSVIESGDMIAHLANTEPGFSGTPMLLWPSDVLYEPALASDALAKAKPGGMVALHVGEVNGLNSAIPVDRLRIWITEKLKK